MPDKSGSCLFALCDVTKVSTLQRLWQDTANTWLNVLFIQSSFLKMQRLDFAVELIKGSKVRPVV